PWPSARTLAARCGSPWPAGGGARSAPGGSASLSGAPARRRAAGRAPPAPPRAVPRSLSRDARGRLWAATMGGGLVRIDTPEGQRPRFVRYTTAEGLTTDHIRCPPADGSGGLS